MPYSPPLTATPALSIIIPAHNEEVLLGATIDALHTAARTVDAEYEIVLVDDSSTDRTADVAIAHHARGGRSAVHQIAAARNAGARAALGGLLVFRSALTIARALV